MDPIALTHPYLVERPGDVFGSYTLERLLGEGSMGRVWLGRHVKLGRPVAIKVLKSEHTQNSEAVGRFFDEARAVNQINHEHIVSVDDFVEEAGASRVYCVMEYLSGQSLSDRLREGTPSLAETLAVMTQVCDALAAAHRLDVVHRDVKPDNIFLARTSEGELNAKVLDFGVAKLTPTMRRGSVASTQVGSILGTPAYMAPEQIVGIAVDARADVYAVGTVLYELLAGRLPFGHTDFGRLSISVIRDAPAALPGRTPRGEKIPPSLAKIVAACLGKQPDERPRKIDDVLAVLQAARSGTAPPRRLKTAVLIAAAVAALLAVTGVTVPLSTSRANPPVVVELPKALAPALVMLSVRSTPSGARVVDALTGAELGITPFDRQLPLRDGEQQIKLMLPGHSEVTRPVTMSSDVEMHVTLTPAAAAPPEPPPRPGKPRKAAKLRDDSTIDPFAQ